MHKIISMRIHMETVWTTAASEIHLARRLLQQRSHHQYTFVSFLAHGFAGLCGNKAALGQCLKLSTSLPRGSVRPWAPFEALSNVIMTWNRWNIWKYMEIHDQHWWTMSYVPWLLDGWHLENKQWTVEKQKQVGCLNLWQKLLKTVWLPHPNCDTNSSLLAMAGKEASKPECTSKCASDKHTNNLLFLFVHKSPRFFLWVFHFSRGLWFSRSRPSLIHS